MKITFLGAVGEVTGSNYLLEDGETKILIDCGLFQGSKEISGKNFDPFSYAPNEIETALITHAHIDHIGRLPILIKRGFNKKIFSTQPTKELAYELLLDSFNIMAQNIQNDEDLPYNLDDIKKTMSLWQTVDYHQKFFINNFEIEYYDAGHILGSASIQVKTSSKTIVFSGDLGNMPAPLVKDTEYFSQADYVLLESTYGNRIHQFVRERKNMLKDLIINTVKHNAVLLIPAFAMERTQELLYELNELVEDGLLLSVPIFIDSALAIKLTNIYQKYLQNPNFCDQETLALMKKGDNPFEFKGLKFTPTVEESKTINNVPTPKVIIAGSGMSEGGRILHHQLRYLPDANNTILFVGFQTKGSRSRQIVDGAKVLNILGQEVAIRAQVKSIGGYSAHADQPLLLKWVTSIKKDLKTVFIVHGELDQSQTLANLIKKQSGAQVIVPAYKDSIEI